MGFNDVNQVTIIGRLTRDPDHRATTTGKDVCSFSVATGGKWTSKTGQEYDDTCFVDCEAWGQTAVFLGGHGYKGDLVYVFGKLRQDKWQDKETGQTRTKIKVVADKATILTGKQSKGQEVPPRSVLAGMDDDLPF